MSVVTLSVVGSPTFHVIFTNLDDLALPQSAVFCLIQTLTSVPTSVI